MVASLRFWLLSCIFLLFKPSNGLSHQGRATADILIDGVSVPPPPPGTNPLVAWVHMKNGGSSEVPAASSEGSPTQQAAGTQNENSQQGEQPTTTDANPFSALQTSQEKEAEECSCVFMGACLYKGACLWIAGSLSFAVLLFLFFVAWGLQWIVAIPAEWILAKKPIREGKVKSSSSQSTNSAPLLQD
ncbi:hypothetical protein, conserved [Eimeria acervulina]|uniref:Transmembrane protein n=1 Tax=Eimeria acervulina TaxID=5801 RepID=U6G9A4_EIMAC|nr:hypothetical protein, conserved [Eimeria acervulina]CDI76102.1 hypothetical protein, conserved [Eimeria acervulina]